MRRVLTKRLSERFCSLGACILFAAAQGCKIHETHPSQAQPSKLQASLVVINKTHIKASTAEISSLRADEICLLDTGERLLLQNDPEVTRSSVEPHFKIRLVAGNSIQQRCDFESGYILSSDVRQEYFQPKQFDVKSKSINSKSNVLFSEYESPISPDFINPVRLARVTAVNSEAGEEAHDGIDFDLASDPAIYSSATGRITFSGWSPWGYGNRMVISHKGKFESLYVHNLLQSQWASGKVVMQDDLIANGLRTDDPNPPFLHFEIHLHGKSANPLKLNNTNNKPQHPQLKFARHLRDPLEQKYFNDLQTAPPERLPSRSPAFKPHKECAETEKELMHSFDRSVYQSRLMTNDFFPKNGYIADLNLYFRLNGNFYQMSLTPTGHDLEKYLISVLQSDSSDFSVNVKRYSPDRLDPLQHYLNQSEGIAELRRLMGEYTDQGALWGARTLLLISKKPPQQTTEESYPQAETVVTEYHNGLLRGFMNHRQECHLSDNGTLDCHCRK